ncbi:MAG: tRNA (N(6)-L-threonylcarbamoyladenosine(37)-C(2))-methylthiotransferase MtaB [Lachnospiraceae bacterium]|nr:tRNA (N(6)-L-threonylcarbamoyladenosine(37)-C(2))-methylthiotransferase MtaB [Lachnospiraceae bacterium]
MSPYDEKKRNLIEKTVAFHTLGCKVNAYESDSMAESLKKAGMTVVPFTDKADVYVINTCSVTNIADRKSRQMISRARKMNPEALVVAAGCYTQLMADRGELDKVDADLILGSSDKHRIAELIGSWYEDRSRPDVRRIAEEKEYCPLVLSRPSEHTRVYLKVQDGCDQFCSYCIIPYGRGRTRSRSKEAVLEEAAILAENGVREFVLTGIHLSSYGLDREDGGTSYNEYIRNHEVQEPLIGLIEDLHALPGVERLRLGSLEPRLMTEAFVSHLSKLPKLCPQFHLSLQSGCDETLKRMNRHYTTADFLESARMIRKFFALPALTTDVIAGFPGETEEEFEQTKAFLKTAGFYELHVFPYSRRKGTAADLMKDQVPPEIKKIRTDELLKLSDEFREAFESRLDGKTVEVLTERQEEIGGSLVYTGYTKEYVRTAVYGDVSENEIVNGVFTKCSEVNRVDVV